MIVDTPQRLLRKNHRKAMPSRVVYLDTETKIHKLTNEEQHRMKLAWTCYVEKRYRGGADTEIWREWHSTYGLCEYLTSLARPETTLHILGHNIFFDLQCSDFYAYFTKWGWLLDFVYEGGGSYILVIHKDKRHIKALSTTNWFDASIKQLGKMIGLEKLEVDFDTTPDGELSLYCRRDVEIIKRVMEEYYQFLTSHDLGRFSLTKASQAFTAYRHRFMTKQIYIHASDDVVDLERSAYAGGRVECFSFGEQDGGPFLSMDINSMYPYIMKNVPLPRRLADYRKVPPLDIVVEWIRQGCVVAECLVKTDEPIYAVKRDGKIFFPVGEFTTFLCSPCLQTAIDRDHLQDINRAAFYEADYLFREYVDFFYALKSQYKRDNNPIYELMTKKFLNSLYGKFAQWQPVTNDKKDLTHDGYYRLESIDLVSGEREIEYKLFNTIVTQTGKRPGRNSLIAISAHITEWSRYLLYSIIEGIGIDRVLYCDTDSVKIRKRDLDSVRYPIHTDRLGALKIEKEFERLTLWGPKHYLTENERKIKGVPLEAHELGEHWFEYFNWPKQKTHMHRQITRFYFRDHVEKCCAPFYDKGVVLENGKIIPITLQESPAYDDLPLSLPTT